MFEFGILSSKVAEAAVYMSWAVRLQDERGKPVSEGGDAFLPFELLGEESMKLSLLKYIDPYGDTYFNTLQMEQFLLEWESVKPSHEDADFKEWEKVRQMAITCRDDPHHYVRFIGD